MTDNKAKPPEAQPEDEQDVEGHSMWLDPNLARDVARNHSKELDRQVKERNRAKEAKR